MARPFFSLLSKPRMNRKRFLERFRYIAVSLFVRHALRHPLLAICSHAHTEETSLRSRSELVEPARGIIRVTGETCDTKRGHVVE